MEQAKHDLIAILRAMVCGDGTAVPPDADWPALWVLAQRNHLETVVYKAMPEEIAAPLTADYYDFVIRAGQQGLLLEQIGQALQKAGIPFAPQKGSILRNDYPQPQFRFMTDLDLCIRPEDRAAVRAAMAGIGGVLHGSESGDDQFRFPGGLGVEFHGRLLYRKTGNGIENYPDWSFVDVQHNRLTEEGYALNLIGHAVGDLAKGGPGVRYILDLWVYRHRHVPQPDWNLVWARLQTDGIAAAAKNLLDLSEYLFGTGAQTALLQEMAQYVLAGGLYGDADRALAAETARAGGKGRALFRQVFRSRAEYENRFPWLRRRPYLLPLAWLLRLIRSFRTNRKTITAWCTRIRTVPKQAVKNQKARLKRFGI